jgi:lipopolysaccharide transport system ATP-binding protein
MSDIAIRVENLGKMFRIGAKPPRYKTFRDTVAGLFKPNDGARKSKSEPFWALKDISFEIKRGEVVGIIGRNGAGKSTLLKILSRITEPTEGSGEIQGRVGSLLEVGTGFHPELTGRENVFLNGAILGMRRAEIEAKFDEIVAFAEVDKFIDTPVKHYSSGMHLRLAFSVAAHLEPEILFVDEVLAVGDAVFQKKCLAKMREVADRGLTIMFVSHNMAAVQNLCNKAMLLSKGHLVLAGTVEKVVQEYLASSTGKRGMDLGAVADRKGAGEARIRQVSFSSVDGSPIAGLVCGKPARITVDLSNPRPAQNPRISLCFRDMMDQRIMHLDSKLLGRQLHALGRDGQLTCDIPCVTLAPGQYKIELWLQVNERVQDWITDAGTVEVLDGDFFQSGVALAPGYQFAVMDFTWTSVTAEAVSGLDMVERHRKGEAG